MLQSAAEDGTAGGRIYDAHIAGVARAAGAVVVVTDNRRQLRGVPSTRRSRGDPDGVSGLVEESSPLATARAAPSPLRRTDRSPRSTCRYSASRGFRCNRGRAPEG